MPNNNTDIPAIMAVADSLAASPALTETQRQEALAAIATFREAAPPFLDTAEQIFTGDPGDAVNVHRLTLQGYRLSSTLHTICRAIYVIENALIAQRKLGSPPLGKEVTGNV